MSSVLQRESFRAMGTVCAVAATAEPNDTVLVRRALTAARMEIGACERVLSRFDRHSDLTRLNQEAGTWVKVDTRLVDALEAALRGRADTHGLFDPTILTALEAAGYDRSFELLRERAPIRLADWQAGAHIEIDRDSGRARVERGAAVDLGGIGKGFSATRALNAMRTAWPALAGGLVDLGGDIAVWGTPPEGGLWRIVVVDPRGYKGVVGTLELASGGVATSGRDIRRFGHGRRLHHLIDPATGEPAATGPISVTVVAASATEAEVYATAFAIAEISDTHNPFAFRNDITALLIPQLGEPVAIGRLPLVRERPPTRIVVNTQVGRFP